MTGPTWQNLNAYVDGELSADAAAEVARAVAADGRLAERVAALAQLKAAAGEALAVDPSEVPPLHLPAAAASSRRRIPGRLAACAAASLLVVLVGLASLWAISQRDEAQVWLAAAQVRHQEWLSSEPDPVPIDEGAVALTASQGALGRVPDLTFARLRLAHVSIDASGRQPGLFVGYVGVNGCRLGLWIAPAAEAVTAELTEHREPDLTSFTWRVGSTGYAVIATDMDEHRLTAIARRLEQLTRREAETRIAGRADPAMDAPCAA